MFEHITAGEQAVRANKKSEALTAASGKITANVDYIAMMCDIDLDDEETNGEEGTDNEQ